MLINHQKIGIVAAIFALTMAAVGALIIFVLDPSPPGESEQLQQAAIDSERYTKQYIQARAKDYQKEFGELQAIKNITCIRQYNTYQTFSEAWHYRNGRTMSTCYAHVEFERGDASIKLIMNRPSDGSAQWYVQKIEVQHGLTQCASSPKGDPSC